jgi:GNAT superfamily N-acetyltransferase
MQIREATNGDAGAVAVLITQLGYATTEGEMQERLQRIRADAQYVSLVAIDQSKVVGFLGMAFNLHYEYSGSYARIVALSVAPEMQGKGAGSALVAAAESIARTRGALMFLVNSGIQRIETHEFYEKRGFLWRSKGFFKSLGTAEQSAPEDALKQRASER